MNNLDKMKEAFANGLGIDVSKVDNSLKYQGIEEWDSISHMMLISELEEMFDIEFETDEVIDMSSFKKAQEIISNKEISF